MCYSYYTEKQIENGLICWISLLKMATRYMVAIVFVLYLFNFYHLSDDYSDINYDRSVLSHF